MFDPTDNDSISPALRALLELFATDLAEVRFPDLDTAVLGDAAALVRERAEVVARAQAALEAARQGLQESQDALLQKGQRALAYARVFAEEDAALSEKLEGIHLPRPMRKASKAEGTLAAEPVAPSIGSEENAPRRRGRPPKVRSLNGASLFSDGASAEVIAAVHEESSNGMLPSA
ncbi:hypothetical protein JGU66_07020 [Myxococcaceae bacterium JPH2]|nr:hypothetical protein [Myxococcaceae bacterium JPH2]